MSIPDRTRGRVGQALVATLLLWLHGVALVLASSDFLHHEVHDAGGPSPHQCLATLFQAGMIEVSDVPELLPAALPVPARVALAESVPLPIPRAGELPPGRGPPSVLILPE